MKNVAGGARLWVTEAESNKQNRQKGKCKNENLRSHVSNIYQETAAGPEVARPPLPPPVGGTNS